MSLPDVGTMTWNKFINNTNLVFATKQISALKLQEYILRKISDNECPELRHGIENNKNIFKDIDRLNIPKVEDNKFSWYEKWRIENL